MGLTHIDDEGRARMVDVSGKPVTVRTAAASGFVRMSDAAVEAVRERRAPKGDPLEPARIAGVMAAKRTSELVPLCHPIPLDQVDVDMNLRPDGIEIVARVIAQGRTGVEMEALVAVSAAALTVYDMCKALDKGMVISEIRLESKTGGRSGDYARTIR